MPQDSVPPGSAAARDGAGRCVMVLGMHRSGTSLLAGTLAAGGVRLGRVLEAPFAFNPTGVREPESLMHMHEDLLRANGGAWDDPPARIVWGDLHRSVRDLFIEARAGPGVWGFKDPRTVLVAEGWIAALGAGWTAVGIFRHPAAVAASLAHRDRFDLARGLGLWLQYNHRLLALQRAYGFPLIEFSADPEQTRAGLVRALAHLGCPAAAADRLHDATVPRHHAEAAQHAPPGAVAALLAELRAAAQGDVNGGPPVVSHPTCVPAPDRPDPVPLPVLGSGVEPEAVHTTRLYPRKRGAGAYVLSGIAARCDWVVLSDARAPHTRLVRQGGPGEGTPRHVFLSMREPFLGLRFFVNRVLPEIRAPFVLISGSEDATLPRQIDRRWRAYDPVERAMIRTLLADSRLIAWFAENLDAADHPKLRPLPLGLDASDDATGMAGFPPPAPPPLGPRPLRALCAHRIRSGPQWAPRRAVSALARGPWAAFVTHSEAEMPPADFAAQLRTHSFVLCVEGGGLDPSPKAWLTLLHGAIPIIRDTPVAPAYRTLPVVVVPCWEWDAITPDRLALWKAALQPEFDDPVRRARVLSRLGLEHWWSRILGTLETGLAH